MTDLRHDPVAREAFARPERVAARMADADRLLADWRELLATHHHLHAPEAAQLLGVPEAALLASRIGTGATRLKVDMSAILASISNWGRVLCAVSNASGVHMPLGRASLQRADDELLLSGEHMQAALNPAATTDAYLMLEHDENHGNSRSLQFFDAAGAPIVKIFIFHKGRFEDNYSDFMAMKSQDQSRQFTPTSVEVSMYASGARSVADDPDSETVQADMKTLIGDILEDNTFHDIEHFGAHSRVKWMGDVDGVRIDETMFHLHQSTLRSHLRYAPVTQIARTRSGAIAFSGENGRLLRIKKGDPA